MIERWARQLHLLFLSYFVEFKKLNKSVFLHAHAEIFVCVFAPPDARRTIGIWQFNCSRYSPYTIDLNNFEIFAYFRDKQLRLCKYIIHNIKNCSAASGICY